MTPDRLLRWRGGGGAAAKRRPRCCRMPERMSHPGGGGRTWPSHLLAHQHNRTPGSSVQSESEPPCELAGGHHDVSVSDLNADELQPVGGSWSGLLFENPVSGYALALSWTFDIEF